MTPHQAEMIKEKPLAGCQGAFASGSSGPLPKATNNGKVERMFEQKIPDGAYDTDETRKRQAKQARELLDLARNYRRGMPTPASRKALGAGVVAAGVLWGVTYIAGLSFIVGFILVIGALVTAYIVVHNRSSYQTPAEHIYDLLAEYTPIHRKGYVQLQKQARLGHLHMDELVDWLSIEVQAVDDNKAKSIDQIQLDKARKRFIDAGETKKKLS
tara:strand:+ start:2793 stop:3434 length:642 start_codon:yes stop_codon:yes gene_type:complete